MREMVWFTGIHSLHDSVQTRCSKQQITVVSQCRHCRISSLFIKCMICKGIASHVKCMIWGWTCSLTFLSCDVLTCFETNLAWTSYIQSCNKRYMKQQESANLAVDLNRNSCKTFKLPVPKVGDFWYECSHLYHSLYLDNTFLNGNDAIQSIRYFTAFNKGVLLFY